MLKTLPPAMTPDLLWILAAMGHGEDLAVVDRNFPAVGLARGTTSGKLVQLPGNDVVGLLDAILALYPLDTFVDDPIVRMEVVGEPSRVLSVHEDVHRLACRHEGRTFALGSLEREAFYRAARAAFAIVQCSEDRPYACFLLKKGTV